MLPALGFEDGVAETKDVRGVARGGGLPDTVGLGKEDVVGALAGRAVREIRLGDEVPAEGREQRIEEGGAGVGFLLLDEAGKLFLPEPAHFGVEAFDFRRARNVGGLGEMALKVVRREQSVAMQRPADLCLRKRKGKLIGIR